MHEVVVFLKRQAIVMGPTPPGTGDIAIVLSLTSLNKTSPTNFDLFSFNLILFIPTSITIAPSFTQFLLTNSGFPIAAGRFVYQRIQQLFSSGRCSPLYGFFGSW